MGQKKNPSVRQALAKQGIPLCFVQEIGRAAPLVLGSRAEATGGTVGKAKQMQPGHPHSPSQAPGGQKRCASCNSWGRGQAGGRQWGQLLWNRGCHMAKASCRTGQRVANMTDTLGIWGSSKGRARINHGRKNQQEQGRSWVWSQGSWILRLWGPRSEGLRTG